MATASNTPARVPTESLAVGVCLPPEFPRAELRIALGRGGHTAVFWHDTVDAAVDACQDSDLDLFLLCARHPDAQALGCVGVLLEASSSTKIVLICERSGAGDVRKALDAGARALVPLSEVGDALVPVIGVVMAGQVSVPGSAGREAGRNVLTAREKQILGQVVLGMSNAEIAAKLFLAESTIKSHLSSAFAKLGVASRNEAAALILDPASGVGLGILTIPSQKISVPG
jgi:two-component system response regulator DesR